MTMTQISHDIVQVVYTYIMHIIFQIIHFNTQKRFIQY